MKPAPVLSRQPKAHLFFYEGHWHVGIRGSRVWGWPFESFERASLYARVTTEPITSSPIGTLRRRGHA